jgi:hypothetical protein
MKNTAEGRAALTKRISSLDEAQRAALAGELEYIGEYLEMVGGLIRRSAQGRDLDNAVAFAQLVDEALGLKVLAKI